MRIALSAAALALSVGITPASAVTYSYEIDAFYQSSPRGASNRITGSFTMDSQIGPASISNVDIQATLPTVGGPFSFSFDEVVNPVGTWNAFGGTSPYLWFANSAFYAGSTYFWMGLKLDTNTNDGSYLIGRWGRSGNPHESEISIPGVNLWQGIQGRVTLEAVPVPLSPLPLPLTLLAVLSAWGLSAYRRRHKAPLMQPRGLG